MALDPGIGVEPDIGFKAGEVARQKGAGGLGAEMARLLIALGEVDVPLGLDDLGPFAGEPGDVVAGKAHIQNAELMFGFASALDQGLDHIPQQGKEPAIGGGADSDGKRVGGQCHSGTFRGLGNDNGGEGRMVSLAPAKGTGNRP
jgi:hypothetical protein